jgi:hypothetical protein
MKVRKWTSALLVLLLLLSLTACGANSKAPMNESAISGGARPEEPKAEADFSYGVATDSAQSATQLPSDRKLIRTVNLTAETEDMDALLSLVASRIAELGGYVESREVYNGSQYSSRYRQATLKIRIPADKLDAFVTDVDSASNIVSSTETAEDVTLQYVATESHLKVLKAEEERLLTFLSEAKGVSEMLEIEKRLTDVRAELEIVTNQLNTYANLVSYGTVHLRIDEVKEFTVVEEEEPTLWQRIGNGFVSSVKTVGKILEHLLVFFVAALPFLVIPGIIVVVVLVLVRRADKKRKNTPPPANA